MHKIYNLIHQEDMQTRLGINARLRYAGHLASSGTCLLMSVVLPLLNLLILFTPFLLLPHFLPSSRLFSPLCPCQLFLLYCLLFYFLVFFKLIPQFLFFLPITPCIQGVTGGTDQTSGECSLGQTIPI